jgi:hypothetical protein
MAVVLIRLDNVTNATVKPALDVSEDLILFDYETAYSRVFLEKLLLLQIIINFLLVIEPEILLPCSQERATSQPVPD